MTGCWCSTLRGFPRKGNKSVGVQRQWCERLGKFDNCQVGVYLAYASSEEPALANMRLCLPKSWAHSMSRRSKCGVPAEAGLADYEVRTWRGWHHHQTLSLIATWFLTQETRQGKKSRPP